MHSESELRTHHRHPVFSNLILIEAPRLSDVLLSPRDISLGGFMVESSQEVGVGDLIECSIEIQGKHFHGCQAVAAWRKENETDPPTWNTGFSLRIPGENQDSFAAAMLEAFPPQDEEDNL